MLCNVILNNQELIIQFNGEFPISKLY